MYYAHMHCPPNPRLHVVSILSPRRQPSGDVDQGPQVASARTGRTGLNWAKRGQDGSGGAGGPAGRRLVVFIIGGATRGAWAFGLSVGCAWAWASDTA